MFWKSFSFMNKLYCNQCYCLWSFNFTLHPKFLLAVCAVYGAPALYVQITHKPLISNIKLCGCVVEGRPQWWRGDIDNQNTNTIHFESLPFSWCRTDAVAFIVSCLGCNRDIDIVISRKLIDNAYINVCVPEKWWADDGKFMRDDCDNNFLIVCSTNSSVSPYRRNLFLFSSHWSVVKLYIPMRIGGLAIILGPFHSGFRYFLVFFS